MGRRGHRQRIGDGLGFQRGQFTNPPWLEATEDGQTQTAIEEANSFESMTYPRPSCKFNTTLALGVKGHVFVDEVPAVPECALKYAVVMERDWRFTFGGEPRWIVNRIYLTIM